MIWIAIACWLIAVLTLAYDAAGNALARRVGGLSYRSAISALPLWKLTLSALGPGVGYVALVTASYFAFGLWGLLASVLAWLAAFRAASAIWAKGINQGMIEIDDFMPARWIHTTIGMMIALAAIIFAIKAI